MNRKRSFLRSMILGLISGAILMGCVNPSESEPVVKTEAAEGSTTVTSQIEATEVEETTAQDENNTAEQQDDYLMTTGEIVAISTVQDIPVMTIQIDPGKEINLLLSDDTKLITWPDEEMEKVFRANPPLFTNIRAFCEPQEIEFKDTSGQTMSAHEIVTLYIDGMKVEADHLVMEDGVIVEVWRGYRYTMYQLEDGTEILREDLAVGPDNVEMDGVSLNELNDNVKAAILAYYEELGLQYSIEEEVKAAYQAYKDRDQEEVYDCSRITQKVLPASINEENVTITTWIRKNVDGEAQESSFETVFDRKTGAVVKE